MAGVQNRIGGHRRVVADLLKTLMPSEAAVRADGYTAGGGGRVQSLLGACIQNQSLNVRI